MRHSMRFIKVKQFTAKLAEGIAKYDFEDDEIRTYICMAVVKLDDHTPTWDTEAMEKGTDWRLG